MTFWSPNNKLLPNDELDSLYLYPTTLTNQKDVISHCSKYYSLDACNTVIKSVLKEIEETEWVVAGLLRVADLLERLETVPSERIECLFVVDEMFRLAQYSNQFNQKAELWRWINCGAIAVIVNYSTIGMKIPIETMSLWLKWPVFSFQ